LIFEFFIFYSSKGRRLKKSALILSKKLSAIQAAKPQKRGCTRLLLYNPGTFASWRQKKLKKF
jgi:hypothetical protein